MHVANSYSYDLPADVFTEGETRPQRTKKAKAGAKAGQTAAPKRSFNESGMDVRERDIVQTKTARLRK